MSKRPSSGKRGNLSQFGLIDIPNLDDDDEPMGLSDDDLDLEAELAAISGGQKKPRARKPAPAAPADLDAMIAASLKDIPSDEDVSGDEDDPDLLNELQELALDEAPPSEKRTTRPAPPPPGGSESSMVSLLQERLSNYTLAEKTAKENGESSRARRFNRGIKTLNDLLKQAKAGRPVKDEDIPPAVSVGKPTQTNEPAANPQPEPQEPAPVPPPRSTSVSKPEDPEPRPPSPPEPKEPPPLPPVLDDVDPAKAEGLKFILKRKEEFKAAALASKHAGEKALALEYLKVVKQFDIVLDAFKSGQEMDLNELPTPDAIASAFKEQNKEDDQVQHSSEPPPEPAAEPAGLITASTVDEALRQRLACFQEQESKAKEQGNASKARRMGRIVKQYQDAIKLNSMGKPIPVDELPTPNGYAPIPTEGAASATRRPAPAPGPAPGPSPSPSPSSSKAGAPPPSSRYQKQLALLLHRQKQFKEAAIQAKKNGDIGQAKEYLRTAKGFDSVIEAAKGGLTVDLKSLPLPPSEQKKMEDTFDVISAEECGPPDDKTINADDDDVMGRLQEQLVSQLALCRRNREHCRALGHVAETHRYEQLALTVKQDLDVVKVAKSLGNVPKFHYENRKFSVVQCNTDLNENDLELTIVRGIAYNVPNPKEIDTYVKFEFPYPQETPVSDRTQLIKDTNSPNYDAVFNLAIQRSARPCLRVFKRHGIKFEVYSRGGWFSRDALLGTASVKLAPLETQVTLHEAFQLMDGRRPAGGSLEVKLRVRTPLLQQQIEHTSHRWLVIDH